MIDCALAGRLGTERLTKNVLRAEPTQPRKVPEYKSAPIDTPAIVAPAHDPASWVEPVAGRTLEFRTKGQARDLTLVPLNRIFDERYAVHWNVRTA